MRSKADIYQGILSALQHRAVTKKITLGAVSALSIALPFGSNVHAEVPLSEAIDLMAKSGRWFLVAQEDQEHAWYSDPYTIVKVSEGVFQINIARFDKNMRYDPPDVMNNTSVYTAEIKCAEKKFRPVGWRYGSVFRKNKVLVNSFIKYSEGSPIHFISAQVCGANISGSHLIMVSPINSSQAIWGEFNKYYVNENDGNIRYIKNTVANQNLYIFCRENIAMIGADRLDAVERSPLRVARDWVCNGLHPDTAAITQAFEVPQPTVSNVEKDTPKPTENSNDEIEGAKRKCVSLGFVRGTPKFGQCVLRLSN